MVAQSRSNTERPDENHAGAAWRRGRGDGESPPMPHALSNDLTQEADLRARGGDVSAAPDAERKANGAIDDDWSDYLDETSDMDAYDPRPARSERHDRGTVANKQADAA